MAGRARRALRPAHVDALVLDADGVSKAAANDARVRAYLTAAERLGTPVVVSAITLAETLRGGRADAAVFRVLNAADVRPVTADVGRAAGELLGATGRADTVDAVVAVTAAACGRAFVLTSDPDDLAALTEEMAGVQVVGV